MIDPTSADLRAWLIERASAYVQDVNGLIDPTRPLGEYGLDSVIVLTLAADIEDHLGIAFDPTALWDHTTIDMLASFLVEEIEHQKPAAP